MLYGVEVEQSRVLRIASRKVKESERVYNRYKGFTRNQSILQGLSEYGGTNFTFYFVVWS